MARTAGAAADPCAGTEGKSNTPAAFVPTNYPGDTVPLLRGRQPRYFPSQSPSDPTVHFIWPEANPTEAVLNGLEKLADRTACLGRAASVVEVRLSNESVEPTFTPDTLGDTVLRVPSAGRLRELELLYQANRRPTPGAMVMYRDITKGEVQEHASSFGSMIVLQRKTGPGLPAEAALTLTNAARRALIQIASSEEIAAADLFHGHGTEQHCAIIALGHVAERDEPGRPRKFADGHLLGLAVVLPRKATTDQRRKVFQCCSQLAVNGLRISTFGEPSQASEGKSKSELCFWTLEVLESPSVLANLRPSTWSRPAKEWASVTPILLDRFPKKKGPSVEEILVSACERAGLPRPVDIEHKPWSELQGVPSVTAFRVHRRADEKPKWTVHAKIQFAQAVRGPVLIGAGRYFGLGLLRPLSEKEVRS